MNKLNKLFGGSDDFVIGEDETGLVCPYCGCLNVHFEEPKYINSDNYQAWEGRGSAIYIPMNCESNHFWNLRIGFHKGISQARLFRDYKKENEYDQL